MHGIHFIYPNCSVADGGSGRSAGREFVFGKTRADLIDLLEFGLGGSVSMKRQLETGATGKPQEKSDKPSAQRRRVNLAKAKKELQTLAKQTAASFYSTNDGESRSLKVIDDLSYQIFSPLSGLTKDKVKKDIIGDLIAAAVEFIFFKQTVIQDTKIEKYSALRVKLQEVVVSEHIDELSQLHFGDSDTKSDPTKVFQVIH